MARPRKWRKVRCILKNDCFGPMKIEDINKLTDEEVANSVIMTIVEYETIRLMDYCNLTQVQCAEYMEIARTSVQNTYDSARKKLAIAITEGKVLRIEGGDYKICKGKCGKCEKDSQCQIWESR